MDTIDHFFFLPRISIEDPSFPYTRVEITKLDSKRERENKLNYFTGKEEKGGIL